MQIDSRHMKPISFDIERHCLPSNRIMSVEGVRLKFGDVYWVVTQRRAWGGLLGLWRSPHYVRQEHFLTEEACQAWCAARVAEEAKLQATLDNLYDLGPRRYTVSVDHQIFTRLVNSLRR